MKVLHVIPSMSASWGGPVSVLVGLIDALAEQGVESEIFTTDLGRSEDIISTSAVRTETGQKGWLSRLWTGHGFSTGIALTEAVQRCDVVHIHELWHHPHYVAHRTAQRFGRPTVISPHGELDKWALGHKRWKKSIYMALLQRRLLINASVVHALTEEESRQTALFAPDTLCEVIPNGIDDSALDSAPVTTESFPELAEKKVVLFLGRLHEKKGLDILAEAISEVRKTEPQVRLLIAGDSMDGFREEVRGFVENAGISDITVFAGHIDGDVKAEALATADVFVLPSRSEGFPMAVLESLAAGVPAVITPECYFPEMAEAGAGKEVQGNASAFAAAIVEVISSDSAQQQLAANAKELVKNRFTWNLQAKKMHSLYERISSN